MNGRTSAPTVLVVDDDPDELAAACKILGLRYPVLAATSGADALRLARIARPAVIILDVIMAGGRDGFSVFYDLQQDSETQTIPVIFLTNVNRAMGLSFESTELGHYLGKPPAAFLEKPVDAQTLLRVTDETLRNRCAAQR